jgi:hypothetical protein
MQEAVSFFSKGGSLYVLDQPALDSWIGAVLTQLHRQAAAMETSVRNLACTMLMALVGKDSSAYLQIGDGAIVAWRDGQYAPITWPDGGEYANTTFFLTDDRVFDHLQVYTAQPPVHEIALLSDGLQRLALQFDTRSVHAPFFEPMFAHLRKEPPGESIVLKELLADYLASPLINGRTDDDKSLILATRRTNIADRTDQTPHPSIPAPSGSTGNVPSDPARLTQQVSRIPLPNVKPIAAPTESPEVSEGSK